MKNLLIVVTMLILIFLMAGRLFAGDPITEAQAIQTIMGEARGEPYEGQVAVGEVLRRDGNLSHFFGYKAKFKITKGMLEKAKLAWKASASSNYSNGATNFEGDSFKKPYWAKDMKVVAHIGHQTFYAKRN